MDLCPCSSDAVSQWQFFCSTCFLKTQRAVETRVPGVSHIWAPQQMWHSGFEVSLLSSCSNFWSELKGPLLYSIHLTGQSQVSGPSLNTKEIKVAETRNLLFTKDNLYFISTSSRCLWTPNCPTVSGLSPSSTLKFHTPSLSTEGFGTGFSMLCFPLGIENGTRPFYKIQGSNLDHQFWWRDQNWSSENEPETLWNDFTALGMAADLQVIYRRAVRRRLLMCFHIFMWIFKHDTLPNHQEINGLLLYQILSNQDS